MAAQDTCPVCKSPDAQFKPPGGGSDGLLVQCPICGQFQLSRTLRGKLTALNDAEVAEEYAPRWVLSAAIRNQYEQGERLKLLTNTVETLLQVARRPDDPFESINLLLRRIQNEVSSPAQAVMFEQEHDYPLIYARGPEEFQYYITKARELDFIETGPDNHGYRLGLEGWRRLKELEEDRTQSSQAFIAMWFDDEMKSDYTEGIEPALDESGYDPIRIDMEEHNEKIDDRIIAEIR